MTPALLFLTGAILMVGLVILVLLIALLPPVDLLERDRSRAPRFGPDETTTRRAS